MIRRVFIIIIFAYATSLLGMQPSGKRPATSEEERSQPKAQRIKAEKRMIPTLNLVSSTGEQFVVPLEIALQSGTIDSFLKAISEFEGATPKIIPLREIDSKTLGIIAQIMWSAYHHHVLERKAFLDAISKDVTLADDQIIPVLHACNFLEFTPAIRLIAQQISKKPAIRTQISQLIQTPQLLSDDTAKEIARIYYLITRTDLPGVDPRRITFSLRDYLEYQPDAIKKHTTGTRTILNLSNLRLGDLDGFRDIEGLNNLLVTLKLAHNKLSQLPVNLFQGLNSLEHLSLANNQLTQLPDNLFHGLNNLQELSLRFNQLTQLPATLFQGLNNLKELHLNNNQLAQLPANLFHGLNNLRQLFLNNNQLTQLPATLFHGLNLYLLTLTNNQLTQLPATLFHGLNNLGWLYLGNNQLTDANKKEIKEALPNTQIEF